ncbi:universal stress protein [Cupriavidus pauculus]|uniref:Universal stress protein n=1 Tax=Cupriavidus pauculus TaxID=82633 RepID=A0A2N5CDZ5_9BURK|nr:universal stress protein [Cupriavidus pauculus]PLQ00439.1 universal stress protein [Cupriavidus pauculus]
MYKHILLPIDGSDLSRKAVSAAITFARNTGARLTPYFCIDEYPFSWRSDSSHETKHTYSGRMEAYARHHLAFVESNASLAGVPCIGRTSTASSPYLGIIAAAEEFNCDVIFMASHGRSGLSGLLIGSETQKVLTHTTIPVLVFR